MRDIRIVIIISIDTRSPVHPEDIELKLAAEGMCTRYKTRGASVLHIICGPSASITNVCTNHGMKISRFSADSETSPTLENNLKKILRNIHVAIECWSQLPENVRNTRLRIMTGLTEKATIFTIAHGKALGEGGTTPQFLASIATRVIRALHPLQLQLSNYCILQCMFGAPGIYETEASNLLYLARFMQELNPDLRVYNRRTVRKDIPSLPIVSSWSGNITVAEQDPTRRIIATSPSALPTGIPSEMKLRLIGGPSGLYVLTPTLSDSDTDSDEGPPLPRTKPLLPPTLRFKIIEDSSRNIVMLEEAK